MHKRRYVEQWDPRPPLNSQYTSARCMCPSLCHSTMKFAHCGTASSIYFAVQPHKGSSSEQRP